MSDPNHGEPVDETRADEATPVDDVVGRVNEGLADAEAASREAVDGTHEDADAAALPDSDPAASAPTGFDGDADAAATDASAAAAPAEPVWPAPAPQAQAAEPAPLSHDEFDAQWAAAEGGAGTASPTASAADAGTDTSDTAAESAGTGYDAHAAATAADAADAGHAAYPDESTSADAYGEAEGSGAPASVSNDYEDVDATSDAATVAYATSGAAAAAYGAGAGSADTVTASEPVAHDAGYAQPTVAAAPQPIFVQAPEAPRARGNRGAAGAIGLLAAVSFGILYLAAALGLGLGTGEFAVDGLGDEALAAVTSWWFWVPVVVFYLAFWLLGAIINRGRWGAWVIFGLLVGAAAYGGHLLGQLFQAPFWTLTASQGAELVGEQLLAPLAVIAFVIGRELTVWFGAWVAARGRRVTELNIEAQREYERTLEAGPQLHHL